MRSVLVTVAASWLTVAASVASAESPPSGSPPPSDSSVPLERLIASVAKKTGKTFVVDPRVHADVVIIGRAPAEVSYAELLGVLDVYGFAGVEDSGFVRVIPDSAIKVQAVPTISPKDTRPASEYVSQIVTVKNVPAAQLVPILRPMIPQYGSMVAFPATNSLIIVDRFANLRRVEGLIRAWTARP